MSPKQQFLIAVFLFLLVSGGVITLMVSVRNDKSDQVPIVEYEKIEIPQRSSEPTPEIIEEALVQFKEACGYDAVIQKIQCNYQRLNEVLIKRARYPDFKKYNDPVLGISFSYPSSISRVTGSKNLSSYSIDIKPINSEFSDLRFWRGVLMVIEDCQNNCPDDLERFLLEKYPPIVLETLNGTTTSTTTIEVISFEKQKQNFANNSWLVGHVSKEGQEGRDEYRILVSVIGNRLVRILDDTHLRDFDIQNAFSEIFSTLNITKL